MNTNRVTIVGRLTAPPDAGVALSGQALASFTIATTYSTKAAMSKESPAQGDVHHVVVSGKLAELAVMNLKAQSRVFVEGRRVRPRRTGKSHRPEIVGDEIILLADTG